MLKRSHRGFRLGRKLLGLWRWALCSRRRRREGYIGLQTCPGGDCGERAAKKLAPVLRWGRALARRLSLGSRVGGNRILDGGEAVTTPKGQVAVYVGGASPGESMRYVVPVVYFNHPMFGELLKEAEEEFGFQHPGGITIPCPAARFERAAAVAAAGKKGFGRC
ncbi:auxin-responsive protein SAUR27-like [Phragmites australis]|uniref:auxin-responsive protein SAUR27-like n=1 Tax=Phragmites australis TaxID=29695 RepID=UPI002D769366|nr:auxin-responsive protein SAUR27-like [Phragmites australis]